MTNVDQFESVFRSSAKEPFVYRKIDVANVLAIADLGKDATEAFQKEAQDFLHALGEKVNWQNLEGAHFNDVGSLLKRVADGNPDLICTYRHLHSNAWTYGHSLGEYLDVLTQHTDIPVLVMPHPLAEGVRAFTNPMQVMAITNHLTGDHNLVNQAAHYTVGGGELFLAHIESQSKFDRFINAIGKIPSIDTDEARTRISAQLIKEPQEYITSCAQGLQAAGRGLKVSRVVRFGHQVTAFKELVMERNVDLVVFNTRDKGQLAMHGLAYSLAVELNMIPLLML